MLILPAGTADLQVTVNGSWIEGLLQASIASNNCFSSDTYALTLAMGSEPLADISFWSSLSNAYVEVRAIGLSDSSSLTLISGMIDMIQVNPISKTVAIEGRDLSSSLIDSYRQQDFVNQTASEIVANIASYHGLNPVVTPTSSNVGRYYGDGYTRLSLGQFSRLRSDWDVVVQLARECRFDVFVQDEALFFQPSTSPNDFPVHVALRDIKSIKFEQTLAMVFGASSRVQSWNSQNMVSYSSAASGDSDGTPDATTTATSQPFLFSASNFTSQQVTESADRYAAEVSRLATIMHIEMPWDLTLSPRTIILIDETNSSFDAKYRIENLERHYSTTSGSTQTIRAVTA